MSAENTSVLDEVRNRMISEDSIVLISFDVLEFSFDLLPFEQEAIKKTRQANRKVFFILQIAFNGPAKMIINNFQESPPSSVSNL